MSEIEFPPIEAPAAAPPKVVVQSLKQVALAHFDAIEPQIRALAEKYRDVAYDCTTTKGMDAAKKARQELRESGRFAVQRAEDALKKEANDLKRAIAPKVEALVNVIKPVEDHVHGQIAAEEERRAAEKAERDRIEAERVAQHQANLDTLAGYVEKARGLSSERIALGIALVQSIAIDREAWQEFADRAEEQKAVTIERLQAMHAQALAAEKAAAEEEARREALAEAEAKLAAERAELARQMAEFQAQQAALAAAAAPALTAAPVDAAPPVAPVADGSQDSDDGAALPAAKAGQETTQQGDQPRFERGREGMEPEVCESTDGRGTTGAPALATLPHHVSPGVGPMGAGQPADAGPTGGDALLREALQLVEYARTPFLGKFPTQPKVGTEWWQGLRQRLDAIEPKLRDSLGLNVGEVQ